MFWYYPEASDVSGCICEWLMTLCTEDERDPIVDERDLCRGSPLEVDSVNDMLGSDAHSVTIA